MQIYSFYFNHPWIFEYTLLNLIIFMYFDTHNQYLSPPTNHSKCMTIPFYILATSSYLCAVLCYFSMILLVLSCHFSMIFLALFCHFSMMICVQSYTFCVSIITIKRIESGKANDITMGTLLKIMRVSGTLEGVVDILPDLPASPILVNEKTGQRIQRFNSKRMRPWMM